MKKIVIMVLSMAGLMSCDLDVNKDPNYPVDVPPSLVFPAVLNGIAVTVGDGMYNYAGFFAQYYDQLPESNQYNAISEYYFTEQSQIIDRSYRTLFAGALEDIDVILRESTNPADRYAATVLRAFAFQLLVDNMDKAPYTEALQGSANSMPVWDDGQTIYAGVLAEIEAAEAELDNSQMEVSDLLLNKNVAQWRGFANALRLRMYLRFVDANRESDSYIAKIKALVDADAFFTGDVKFDSYSDEADKRNPWYSANKVELTTNHTASYPIVSYMLATNDPRIEYNFEKAKNTGEYAGELPGSKTELAGKKDADYSALKYYPTKPVYFFTQSELQFLLAEVYLRFYSDDAKAKAAYEAAIDADFAAREMSGSSSLYDAGGTVTWASAPNDESKLTLIYMQKWVALCYMDHMEAWSEIRRTDCPKLSDRPASEINSNSTVYTPGELISPMRNGFEAGTIVKRMFFPLTARQLNTNTPAAVPATTPVWWDIK
ncbi:hypothetical protein EZS27_032133 [termite gut metagenome]|uniref:SusD/RagB family nutrient-binding outer membrane lipoprotein n=1 Tax=termite gut metagenome TaxID=433724 RepID=A0A5J4QB23_9ZZZZ